MRASKAPAGVLSTSLNTLRTMFRSVNDQDIMEASCHSSTFIASFAVIEKLISEFTIEAKAVDLLAKQLMMQPRVLCIPLLHLV